MRKTIFILSAVLMLFCGCGNKFELKADTITLEAGEELSDNLSQYIKTRNYDDITVDVSNLSDVPVNYGGWATPKEQRQNREETVDSGYVLFTNSKGQQLKMTVIYRDTLPPVIGKTEVSEYTGSYFGTSDSINLYPQMVIDLFLPRDNNKNLLLHSGSDYFCVEYIDLKFEEDVEFHPDIAYPDREESYIYLLPAGDYNITFTIGDFSGNSATYDVILHVIEGKDPNLLF